jgi:hypothetical protein
VRGGGCGRLTLIGRADDGVVFGILFLDNYKTLFYLFLQGLMLDFVKI